MKKTDLIGIKFNRLTVISENGRDKHGRVYWECLCECGNEIKVISSELKNGHTKSCGCLNKERIELSKLKDTRKNSAYRVWDAMKQRCVNPNNSSYNRYGAKGIKVCDRWLNSFQNFLEDMGERPSKNHSIGRIKSELGYYKDNCRWETPLEQSRNISSNVWLEYNGETMLQTDWERKFGLKNSTIYNQLRKGKTFKEVCEYYQFKMKEKISA